VAKKRINADLIADLTWAELYTAKIREHLNLLSPAVKKTSTKSEMTESAALLRQQLANGYRTAAKLGKMVPPLSRR
jgi:hypothetical protein